MTSCRRYCCGHLALCITVLVTVFGCVRPMRLPPPPVGSWNRAQVSLVDNGYRGLVLAIAEGVLWEPELIEQIKTIFTEASALLYQATNHRAYFHELAILVPESWPDQPTCQPAFHENFHTANILVNTATGRDIPTRPFVKQPGMCGEEGAYLHLTRELIGQGNQGPWGILSRVLVHEWGHLRWGLFDEYPSRPGDPHFYLNDTGGVEPTRCSKAVTGEAVAVHPEHGQPDARCDVAGNRGHLPDPRCRFQPLASQKQGARGSLMYAHFIDQITGFCHSDGNGDAGSLHNAEAPNRQNALCDGRSAWDVMLTSRDFAHGANQPREGAVTVPQFSVKRAKKRRVVFVLDTSSSMNDNGKFAKLLRATSYYLTDVLPKDTWVALVQFNATASVLAPLSKIRYKSSRKNLVDKLPNSADGNSSIGAGILKALEVLSSNGESQIGGVILVMSDGLEDAPPLFHDVADGVRAQGVLVDAMAYSAIRDENFHLPDEGGGGFFFIPFAENGTIATQAPTTEDLDDEEYLDWEEFLTIARRSEMFPGHGNGTNDVHIDSTVGSDTVFRFSWEIGQATAIVRTPEGLIISPGSPEYSMDMEGRQVEIRIQGVAQSGTWGYGILNMNDEPQTMRVHVYSKPSNPAVPPLRARVHIKRSQMNFTEDSRVIIYGEVMQGEFPVIRAKVRALIKRPADVYSSDYLAVELFDLGTGADTEKDDGIYSAYFMGFTGDGVYKVTLEVENEAVGQAKKITFPQTLGGVMPSNWNNTRDPVLVDVDLFTRVTQAVEFTVVSAPTTDEMSEADMFPPARVTDLRVASFSGYEGRLTLRWTAPGDDYDVGTAASYDLRCSHTFKEIASNFSNARVVSTSDILSGYLSAPQVSGSEETLVLQIPTVQLAASDDLMLFLAFRLRAIDDSGLAGEASNVATAVVDYGAIPPPSSTSLLSTVATDATHSTTSIPEHPLVSLGRKMAIVLGVSVSLLLFSMVVLIIACRTKRRKDRENDHGNTVSYTKARSIRRVSDAWVLEEV